MRNLIISQILKYKTQAWWICFVNLRNYDLHDSGSICRLAMIQDYNAGGCNGLTASLKRIRVESVLYQYHKTKINHKVLPSYRQLCKRVDEQNRFMTPRDSEQKHLEKINLMIAIIFLNQTNFHTGGRMEHLRNRRVNLCTSFKGMT